MPRNEEEVAKEMGIPVERVRALRQELRDNTPRAREAKRQVAAAFADAEANNYDAAACARLRAVIGSPPKIKPTTVQNLMQDILLMRRAKEMGG